MTLRTRFTAATLAVVCAVGLGGSIGLSAAARETDAAHKQAAVVPHLVVAPPAPGSTGVKADDRPGLPSAPKPAEPKAAEPPRLGLGAGGMVPKGEPKAGLTLPASATVESSELFITVAAETEATDVQWIVVASVPVKYEAIGQRLVLGTPAGAVIHVYAYGTVGNKATPPAKMVVTVKTAQPHPQPPVDPPAPPVPPTPPPPEVGADAGRLFVTVVEDPTQRIDHPWLAEVLNNKPMRDAFEKAGITFRVLSVRDPEYARARLAPYVEAAGGLPALVVQNGKGKVFAPQKLPQTPDAVKAAVDKAATQAKE